jgi:4-hydroxybenzoate polyprenyltransferase
MRLNQWIKNLLLFAPVIFAGHIFQIQYIKRSLVAFLLFGLVASSIYIINDCFDRKRDIYHVEKSKRPIASGKLLVGTAVIGAVSLLIISLVGILFFNYTFFIISLIYVIMNLLYSGFLKKIVILDVLVIAVGFGLRVEIGGEINAIEVSHWILIVTFLAAIFLALIKRRQELVKINEQENNKIETRKTLKKYTLPLLDQLISIATATTLISYIIYVQNPVIQQKHSKQLYLTIPFVVFGIFRYLYLTYVKGKGENPSEIVFTDFPFSLNIILWVVVFVILILN